MKPGELDPQDDRELLARLGLSRETDIVLDAEGQFWAGGARLSHPGVSAAFARWLTRAPDGRWALENPIHWVYLRVLGAPLHALGVRADAQEEQGRPLLLLAGGEEEPLRPPTLREGPDGVLYAGALRQGEVWAVRLSPRAALDLAPWLSEVEGRPALVVAGEAWPIPRVADPLARWCLLR